MRTPLRFPISSPLHSSFPTPCFFFSPPCIRFFPFLSFATDLVHRLPFRHGYPAAIRSVFRVSAPKGYTTIKIQERCGKVMRQTVASLYRKRSEFSCARTLLCNFLPQLASVTLNIFNRLDRRAASAKYNRFPKKERSDIKQSYEIFISFIIEYDVIVHENIILFREERNSIPYFTMV